MCQMPVVARHKAEICAKRLKIAVALPLQQDIDANPKHGKVQMTVAINIKRICPHDAPQGKHFGRLRVKNNAVL